MANVLSVHVGHPRENLPHVVFDVLQRNWLICLLGLLNDFFQVLATVLKDNVLDPLALFVLAVVNVKHLDAVVAIAQLLKDFKFAGDVFAGLSGALDGDLALAHCVISFKDVTYQRQVLGMGRVLPKEPEPMILLGCKWIMCLSGTFQHCCCGMAGAWAMSTSCCLASLLFERLDCIL